MKDAKSFMFSRDNAETIVLNLTLFSAFSSTFHTAVTIHD